jgi:hypothetical protein
MHSLIDRYTTVMNGTSRQGTVFNHTLQEMIEVLGEPNTYEYPDKVDFYWMFRSKSSPSLRVGIWNYKNGPAYGYTVEDINEWSMYVSKKNDEMNEFLAEIFGENFHVELPRSLRFKTL